MQLAHKIALDPTPAQAHYFRQAAGTARRRKPRYSFAFAEIISEEQAYWLGFLAADGSVKNHHALVVHLAGRDEEHLLRLRSFLGSAHTISTSKSGSVSLTIHDRQIASDLFRLGVRTGEERFVPTLPDALIRHYFRGLFDGDGHIAEGCMGQNLLSGWQVMLTSDHPLCEAFALHMRQQTGGKMRVFFHDKVWRCGISGREYPKKAAAWLYAAASVYLPRKQAVFMAMTEGTGVYVDHTVDCFRPQEVATQVGKSRPIIMKYITTGRLPAHRVGSRWWIRKTDAETWYRQLNKNLVIV